MPQRLSHRLDERALALVLVLPTDQDRAPLRTALSVATGRRGRIRALCLSHSGEGMPTELRIAMFGLAGLSEADLAIQHLIASATRGAHQIVSPLPDPEDERLTTAQGLGDLPPNVLLVVGWTRGGPLPRADRLRPLIAAHRGDVVILVDADGPLPREVLGLLPPPGDPARGSVLGLVQDLERTLPAFLVPEAKARGAIGDCTDATLVVAALPPQTDLESAVPGRVALLLSPADDRAERVEALIERVRSARQSPTRAASGAAPRPPRPAP